jgi:hypothetical protein
MQKETNKDIAEDLFSMLNIMGNREQEESFVKKVAWDYHRTIQQKAAGLFLQCFVEWAKQYDQDNFDLRNEATVKLAKKVVDLLEKDDTIINGKVVLPYI